MSNDSSFVDMKTAASLIGRSYSTVRNIVNEMSEQEKKKYLKSKGKRIFIRKDFLASNYTLKEERNSEFEIKTLALLEKQLAQKDAQIAELMERLKEVNYNHAGLQKYLIDLGFTDKQIEKVQSIVKLKSKDK